MNLGDKATGGWRKFKKKELQNLYSSPIIIRNVILVGHVDQKGDKLVHSLCRIN
jgi:hypothetical protein